MPILGASAALASNAAWLWGSIIFSRVLKDARPLGINLGRGIITLFYVGLCLALTHARSMDRVSFLRLGLSGLLGMAVGDTLFFEALARLGPRLTILVGMIGPVFTILLGVGVLHDHLAAMGWCGVALTLAGVTAVVWVPAETSISPAGIVFAVVASLSMSCGIILAKEALQTVSPLQAVFVRMLWSVAALTLLGTVHRQLGTWLAPFRDPTVLRQIHGAVVVVVFGGFCLSMVALQCLQASVVATLTSTEPLFALGLTWLLLKQPIHGREALGACLGVVGVVLIYLSPI